MTDISIFCVSLILRNDEAELDHIYGMNLVHGAV